MLSYHVLSVLLLAHLAAANIAVNLEYNQAPDTVKQLVDKMVDNYCKYTEMEVLKIIPKLVDDPQVCNSRKTEYADNIESLLVVTKTEVGTLGVEGIILVVDTKEGKKTFPYLKKEEGKVIECQKVVSADGIQTAVQQQINQALSKLPTEKMKEIKTKVTQSPEFAQVTNAVNIGASEFKVRQEAFRKMIMSVAEKSGLTAKTEAGN